MKMNLPNKLTILRIIMTPVFLIALLWDFPFHYLVASGYLAVDKVSDRCGNKEKHSHKIVEGEIQKQCNKENGGHYYS